MIQILHQTHLVDHQVITVILLMKNQVAPILVILLEQLDIPLPSLTEANSPGSTQDMAIVIDDEEKDSPLCPPGQNLDVIDLTKDTDMEQIPQSETLFQPQSSNFEERKRKANDFDTYHHPGKLSCFLVYPF